MPPPNANTRPQPRTRNQKRSENAVEEQSEESGDDEHYENRAPHEYYCISRPEFDFENENKEKPEDDQLDEDAVEEQYVEAYNSGSFLKSAVEYPDHKWTAMWQTCKMVHDWSRHASYTNPENFEMYIHNDFHGYGLQELIENFLLEFNKELYKKNQDESSVKQIWAIMAGLIHWLRVDVGGLWEIDDGPRWCKIIQLIGIAFLETLHTLDVAKLLFPSSTTNKNPIQDLELVISLYLEWGKMLGDYDVEDEELEWRKNVLAYVKKGKIDIVAKGCAGMRKIMEEYKEIYGDIAALKDAGKSVGKTRWKWKKFHKEFDGNYGMGGESHNIMKMNRKKRARFAYNNTDPLAEFTTEELESGELYIEIS